MRCNAQVVQITICNIVCDGQLKTQTYLGQISAHGKSTVINPEDEPKNMSAL